MQFVEVEHNDVGRTTVPQSRVKHLAEGWRPVDGGSIEQIAAPYDPADHTVDDVLAYLEQADEDEQNRVLDAERAGKARVSIVGA